MNSMATWHLGHGLELKLLTCLVDGVCGRMLPPLQPPRFSTCKPIEQRHSSVLHCNAYIMIQVGLGILDPLPNSTGGAMYLYASVEESALPQDLYRRLAGGRAFAGLMRVRTSPELKAVRFYGRLYADQQVCGNLCMVVAYWVGFLLYLDLLDVVPCLLQ